MTVRCQRAFWLLHKCAVPILSPLELFKICPPSLTYQEPYEQYNIMTILIILILIKCTYRSTSVSLDPRNGICRCSQSSARIHSLSASRLLLISAPSNRVCGWGGGCVCGVVHVGVCIMEWSSWWSRHICDCTCRSSHQPPIMTASHTHTSTHKHTHPHPHPHTSTPTTNTPVYHYHMYQHHAQIQPDR